MRDEQFRMVRCSTQGVTAVVARARRCFARHTHQEFGIGVMEHGGHRSHSGRGQVEARAGDVITVNPGEVHDGASLSDMGRGWRILYFDPALAEAAAGEIFESCSCRFELTRPVVHDRRTAGLLRMLFAAETGAADALRREQLLFALLASLGECCSGRQTDLLPSVALAKSRIDDDPAAKVSLAELARIGGMGRFQLLRAFARATGLTPHVYVVQKRTDLARSLIAAGESLAGAAAAAGFADQSHMTRAFAARYGLTPSLFAATGR